MEVFFGLLVLVLPVVFAKSRRRDDDRGEVKADRPAGPGAEAMAVPAAGEIGPAAEPPRQRTEEDSADS